jgi:hypothetical protein
MKKDYKYFKDTIYSDFVQELFTQVDLFDTSELFHQFYVMMNSESIGEMLSPNYLPDDYHGELMMIADKQEKDLTTQDIKRVRLFMARIVMEKRDGIKTSNNRT